MYLQTTLKYDCCLYMVFLCPKYCTICAQHFSSSANKKETIAWCGDDLLLHEVKQDAFYIVHSDIREFGFAIGKFGL